MLLRFGFLEIETEMSVYVCVRARARMCVYQPSPISRVVPGGHCTAAFLYAPDPTSTPAERQGETGRDRDRDGQRETERDRDTETLRH